MMTRKLNSKMLITIDIAVFPPLDGRSMFLFHQKDQPEGRNGRGQEYQEQSARQCESPGILPRWPPRRR